MGDKDRVRALVQNGRIIDAKSLCDSLCKRDSDDAEAWFLLGMLNGMLEDFREAEQCYNHVIRMMPDLAAAYYNKGVALRSLKLYDKAVLAFNKVIELDPSFENIYVVVADAHLVLGDHRSASAICQAVLIRRPADISQLYKLGKLFLQGSQLQDAERCFQKIVSLNSKDIDAGFNLAFAMQLQGRLDEAEIQYKNILVLSPDYSAAYNNLGILNKERGAIDSAIEYFNKALQYRDDFADAYSNLGHALHVLGKYDEALLACKKANALNPKSPETHYSLGLQYEKLGDYSSARLNYSQASLLDAKSIRYSFVLARISALEKNYTQAISLYNSVIDNDPSFIDAYSGLGKLYLDMGEKDSAVVFFRKALVIQQDHLTANYYLAELDPGHARKNSQAMFVEKLFDDYADSFESELVDKLQYKTPQVIYQVTQDYLRNAAELVIFDLGCGTGLCGELFRGHASRLVGIDLSAKIIEKAREKSVYDELYVDELLAVLQKEDNTVDLILAADVFVYIGDLAQVFNAVEHALSPGGLFVFSVEHKEGEGYQLQGNGRYSHSVEYINAMAASAMLVVSSITASVLRKEYGSEVQGDIYLLESVIL